MNLTDAVAAGVRNQVSQLRHLATHSAGGQTEENDNYLFFAGAHNYPGTYTNGVIRKSPNIGAAELLARADAFFESLRRGYYLWVRDDVDADLDVAARRRQFWLRPPDIGNPCIVRTEPLPPAVLPAGYSIEVAESDEQRREYLSLVVRNYDLGGMPAHLAEAVLFSIDSLRSDAVRVFLARSERDGEVHSGMSAFLSDECVGIEWVATDLSARGCGLGSAIIECGTNWGFEQGVRYAWGIASQQGLPVWRKIGFEVPTYFRRYLAVHQR